MRELQIRQAGLPRAEQLAAAAKLEVDLRQLEAVGRAHERFETLDGGVGQVLARARDQKAVRLLRSAADASAQLVQLREAEAVGFLHDHDRCVRDVDADFDHRRRDQHVELVGLEARHQLTPLRRPKAPVQQADPIVAQLAAPQTLCLGLSGARLGRLRLLDQWTDDVRLASCVEVLPQSRVRIGAPLLRHPGGHDRLPIRGRLGDLGHGEIAVHGQCKRARDRRRRHVQHMRRAPFGERLPLLAAEAMLLVDDRDREAGKLHALLDERVRADDDVGVDVVLDGPGEERARHAELRADVVDGQEMLLCKRLSRRHQRSLTPRLDRAEQSVERDDRLPGADVALEQPLHRHGAPEVGVDLRHRALLMLGQIEREHAAVARDELARLRQRRRNLVLALAALQREPYLQQQQLVESQATASGLRLAERTRLVHGPERVDAWRQCLPYLHGGRQRIGESTWQRCSDELTQLLRRDLLARRVNGSEIRRRLAVADVEAADVEAVPPLPSAQTHLRPGLQLPLEPRLVEPGGGDGRAPVRDARRQHLEPPAAARRHGQPLAADGDLVLTAELGDPQLFDRLLVAERLVQQQVAHGGETETLELLPDRRPDARQRLDRAVEYLSARKETRPRPRIRLYAGEPNGHSTSSNQKKPPVPGPACVPSTAPSVVTTSISAFGRSKCTIFSSARARSGASACAMPTFSVGVSFVVEVNADTNSCIAFWFPRTRFTGTTSRSIVRIGFTCSGCRAHALARPMRPRRRRNSSVSTVNIRCACSRKRMISRSTSSSVVPCSSRCWIASPSIAIAADALSESTVRTLSPPSSAAGFAALWYVPESAAEMCKE